MTSKSSTKRDREKGICPLCGDDTDDVVKMTEATRENETMPAMAYDHSGGPLHIEWADGELTQG